MNRPVLQSGKLPVCKGGFRLEPDECSLAVLMKKPDMFSSRNDLCRFLYRDIPGIAEILTRSHRTKQANMSGIFLL